MAPKKESEPADLPAVTTRQKVKVWMQVLVSLVVLAAGFAILTSPNYLCPKAVDASTKQWASGWIGAVIGYWLS